MFEKKFWRNFQHLKELPTISCMMLKVFYLGGKLHFLCFSVLHLGNRSHVLVHLVWSMIVLPEIISVQNCFWNRSRKTAERQWIKLSLLGSSCQFRGQGMSVRLHTFLLCLMLLYWILKWWILLRGTLFLLQTILNWIEWKLNLIVVAICSLLHTMSAALLSRDNLVFDHFNSIRLKISLKINCQQGLKWDDPMCFCSMCAFCCLQNMAEVHREHHRA